LLPKVVWLDRLPPPVSGVVIANEVVDALPVSRFTIRGGDVLALGVVEQSGGFAWSPAPATPALRTAVDAIARTIPERLAEGYTSEVRLELPGWMRAVASSLAAGTVLAFDYGMSRREYYHPDRRDGTLTCHYRHRAHADPFHLPGLQDITAWVDFTALAGSGDAAGLHVAGYATLGHFLVDAGIGEELARAPASGAAGVDRLRQAQTLLMPGEMGERFKVLALSRGPMQVTGFGFRDLRHLL
jgi:SAM-dependent MidA family methyltransferase